MITQQHIIKKQVFDIYSSSEENAFNLQQTISRIFYKKVLPRLDQLFSSVSEHNIFIRFDLLQIDAGVISENELEQLLPDRIIAAVREIIFKESGIPFQNEINDNTSITPAGNNEQQPTVTKRKMHFELAELFFYFLRTGNLPWWVPVAGTVAGTGNSYNKNKLEAGISELLDKEPDAVIPLLKQHLLLAGITKRIVFQFSGSLVEKIIYLCVPGFGTKITAVIESIRASIPLTSIPASDWNRFILEHTLARIAMDRTESFSTENLLKSLLKQVAVKANVPFELAVKNMAEYWFQASSKDKKFFVSIIRSVMNEYAISTTLLFNVRDQQIDQLLKNDDQPIEKKVSDNDFKEESDAGTSSKKAAIIKTSGPNEKEVANGLESALPANLPEPTETKDSPEAGMEEKSGNISATGKDPSVTFEIAKADSRISKIITERASHSVSKETVTETYILNAGLVLIAPYLTSLFNAFDWTEDKKLIATDKAIHMTQYLATGTLQEPEYNLPLNKILCGCPLEAPVALHVDFTNEELAEAEEMLISVIENWPVLKNTSPDALRETFLMREGRLSRKEDGNWLLQVEQKGVDILLDKLPWTISMLKLPWMPEMLFVDWA